MKHPLPENESARLAALQHYRILDTAPEDAYDDIVSLAAYLTGVPIAAISLIDVDRQWFKARIGLSEYSTPREQAFCAHTILQTEIMEVPDASKDARFESNPLVTGKLNIRFYAGAPLVTHSGEALGSICIMDRHPRKLSVEQRDALKKLAGMVMRTLEYRHVCAELAEVAANMKTLSGLLPICSWCKKVREDEGYWEEVESYIKNQTGLDLTQSICPDCQKIHFPPIRVIKPNHEP
jgi:GAF domain-containing protein